jgi:hypothetical protein
MSRRAALIGVLGAVLCSAAAIVVLVVSSMGQDSGSGTHPVQPGVYSYEEARELGLIGAPLRDRNLPACTLAELLPRKGPPTGLGTEDLGAILSPELTQRKKRLLSKRRGPDAGPGEPALCAVSPESAGAVVIVPPTGAGR